MKKSNKILLTSIVIIVVGSFTFFTVLIKNSDFIDKGKVNNSIIGQIKSFFSKKVLINGNGIKKIISIKLPELNKIAINGLPEIKINYCDKNELYIKGDQNIIEKINHFAEGSKLTVGLPGNIKIKTKIPLVITVKIKTTEFISLNGALKAEIKNVSGSKLDLTVNGASSIKLNGKVDKFYITCRGANEIYAKDLIAEKVKTELLGASDVTVYAEKELDATLIGASTLSYYGNPVNISKTMVGACGLTQKYTEGTVIENENQQ